MKKHFILFCGILGFSLINFKHNAKLFAQVTGGQNAFSYLQLNPGTHNNGLGGIVPSFVDKKLEFVRQNPALLELKHHNDFLLSYSQWSSIKHMNLQYAYTIPNWETNFSIGLQYLDYGTMSYTNIFGEDLGQIKAQDYAIYLSSSRVYKENWSYGSTLKFAVSNLGSQTSVAGLLDVGINYRSDDSLWQIALVAKNMGVQLKKYYKDQDYEPLPFDLQIGVAKRLANIPLTLMMSAHHLYKWDIRYNNPLDQVQNLFEDEDEKESSYFADKLFRHINFGAQIHLAKRVYLNIGYSHLRRSELAFDKNKGLSGFNFGIQARLYKFHIGYSLITHSIAGPIHELGVQLKLSDYFSLGSKTETWHWKQ